MEEYKGRCASSGKEKMHEQSYPHPKAQRPAVAVSYTHLTLPTILLV